MSVDPLISCIVPVYNGERFLSETLDSVLAQTYKSLEVIVVDDGSTDQTPAVAARYGDRLRYARQENRGPAAARNHGATLAKGDLLAFLDADDLWHSEKLVRQHRRFVVRPDLDLSFSRFQNFWESELEQEQEAFDAHPLAKPISGYCIGTLLARRDVFDRFGPFDEGLRQGENISWFLDARKRGAVIEIMPEVLMSRRFHPTSLTRREAPQALDGFLSVVKKWKDGKSDAPSGSEERPG